MCIGALKVVSPGLHDNRAPSSSGSEHSIGRFGQSNTACRESVFGLGNKLMVLAGGEEDASHLPWLKAPIQRGVCRRFWFHPAKVSVVGN